MTTEAVDAARPYAGLLRRYWGFDTLRPLQADAVAASLARTDSLVVLPTGGGKSLCYQLPPLVADRLDVVVSPLISLMKDQVDGLVAAGYPAAALHSASTPEERRAVFDGLREGTLRLLFVSPERLALDGFADMLAARGIGAFAVDEAHCISHWGHDFRPEYRQLRTLRNRFPGASIHAFTATATPRVQDDIVEQLALRDPHRLVGSCDRPNLVYRIVPRREKRRQVLEVLERHRDEATIVYCLSRKETEEVAAFLRDSGIPAEAYHAGMSGTARHRVQEAFAEERLSVVVATVAFGMGIDRSDVRCVIHAAMPKSIEHYQQEAGRAGRDGLAAECVLLYSPADALRWRNLMERSHAEQGGDEAALDAQVELLRHMQGLCGTIRCRHRALVEYFGQPYERDGCGACDVCLGEVQAMPGSTVLAQKILSCVARLEQRYGVGTVVEVLHGAATEAVLSRGHDKLSTYGLLRDLPTTVIRNLVHQLVDQGHLVRTSGDRPIVQLGPGARSVLRGEESVQLLEPRTVRVKRAPADLDEWAGVDRDLFDRLRALRRTIAEANGVPPYVVFNDRTLRDIARKRPENRAQMRDCHGVGEQKLAKWGDAFLAAVRGESIDVLPDGTG